MNVYASLCVVVLLITHAQPNKLPNIIIMLADDLGIGDVGCFGNRTLRTPNIDKIAAEGARLTHHLAAASVCTPSRAALLTGRYPIRMGMTPTNFVRVNLFVASPSGLPENETTIAELVRERGYKTAIVGKWHLGMHCTSNHDNCHNPLNQGFDYFYGLPLNNLKDFGDNGETVLRSKYKYIDQVILAMVLGGSLFFYFLCKMNILSRCFAITLGLVVLFLPCSVYWVFSNQRLLNGIVMRNLEVVDQPLSLENLTQKLVREGVGFIERRHEDEKPFLLIMSWVQVHTALCPSNAFRGKSQHGLYGDSVEELDWSVGEILNALERFDLKTNTLVYFTSDHGAHVEEVDHMGQPAGGSNGIFRGGKFQAGMEGGIRVPTVAMWPGRIEAGTVVKLPTSLMDVFPTVAEITGAQMPQDRIIDGKSMMRLLTESSNLPPHPFLFHYCLDEIHAARYTINTGDDVWKVHYATPNWLPGTQGCAYLCDCTGTAVTWHDPPLLYNIAKDPSESYLLDSNKPTYARIIGKINEAVEKHKKTLTQVPNQFSWHQLFPRPWMQPCCNFPSCHCKDPKFEDL